MLDPDRFRKVAVLVDSLDAARADALLDQMPETQRAMIRNLVVALEDVTDEEREQVIADFIGPGAVAGPATSMQNPADGGPDGQTSRHLGAEGKGFSADISATRNIEQSFTDVGPSSGFDDPSRLSHSLDAGSEHEPSVWLESSLESSHAQSQELKAQVNRDPDPYGQSSVREPRGERSSDDRSSGEMRSGDTDAPRYSMSEFHEVAIGTGQQGAISFNAAISNPPENRTDQPSAATGPAFGFVRDEDVPKLVRCIECERPQIIARIVSSLSPKMAASVVALLSDDVRRQVLRRLPSLRDCEPEVMHELERCVWGRFNQLDEAECDLQSSGFKSLEAILEATEGLEQIEMIESLLRERPDLRSYLTRRFDLEAMRRAASLEAEQDQGERSACRAPLVDPQVSDPQMSDPRAFDLRGSHDEHSSHSDADTVSMVTELEGDRRSIHLDDEGQPELDRAIDRDFGSHLQDLSISSDDGGVTLEFGSARRNENELGRADDDLADVESPPGSPQVSNAEKHDSAANPTTKRTVSFDGLMQLDDHSLSNLLSKADPKLLLIALAGAHPKLIDKLLKQIPRREAKQVKKRIDQIGPIRLQDIQHAQQELTSLAIALSEQGLISQDSIESVLAAA